MSPQAVWVCNNGHCPFRNSLLAGEKLSHPHVCSRPAPIPVFVNPFPPPKPVVMLPPPPLAPAPPGSFYFPPPNVPIPGPPPGFPLPGPAFPQLPPAPMPPGPFMLPPPQFAPPLPMPPGPFMLPPPQLAPQPLSAYPPPQQQAPPQPQQQAQQAEQKQSPAVAPDPPKSPSIGSVVHEKSVHTFQPKKGPISKEDKEALCDFEERTRRQDYRDLAQSSKHSQHKSGATPTKKAPSIPPSILKNSLSTMAAGVNQQVHVNVYNTGHGSKEEPKTSTANSPPSVKSRPAKGAASIREEAMKRAHSLANSKVAADTPAALMTGALKPPSAAGSHPASKAPSHVSQGGASKPPSHASQGVASKAPSHASQAGAPKPTPKPPSETPSKHSSKAGTNKAAPPKPPSKHGSKASNIKPNSHASKISRGEPHRQNPVAIATVIANAQVSPTSIQSWREGVQRPLVGA